MNELNLFVHVCDDSDDFDINRFALMSYEKIENELFDVPTRLDKNRMRRFELRLSKVVFPL